MCCCLHRCNFLQMFLANSYMFYDQISYHHLRWWLDGIKDFRLWLKRWRFKYQFGYNIIIICMIQINNDDMTKNNNSDKHTHES